MRLRVLALALVLASSSVASAQFFRRNRAAEAPAVPAPPDKPDCIRVASQPVFNGVGYNHVVEVVNRCDRPYECRVSTDVDPAPEYSVRIAPGEEKLVPTRLGSPARAFRSIVVCR